MENNQNNNNIQVEETKNNTDNNKEDNNKENSSNNTENNNKVDNKKEDNTKSKNEKNKGINITCSKVIQIILSVLFLLINLWILLAAVKRYSNLNKKFIDLRQVKSDEFVTRFINEFIEICSEKSALYYASIIVSSIAMFLHLVGLFLIIIAFI